MSTSKSLDVVAHFCKPHTPTCERAKVPSNYALLFRIKVQSPMEYGADISWLSTVPQEDEVVWVCERVCVCVGVCVCVCVCVCVFI